MSKLCICGKKMAYYSKMCWDCRVRYDQVRVNSDKICFQCNVFKPIVEYYRHGKNYRRVCIECDKENSKVWRDQNKERVKLTALRVKFKRYGLDQELGCEIFFSTHNCQICKTGIEGKNKVIDHCHYTGKYRGIICPACNKGLGAFTDSTIKLKAAKNYLLKDFIYFQVLTPKTKEDKARVRKSLKHQGIFPYPGLIDYVLNVSACQMCNLEYEKTLHNDHCHASGEFRGCLCFKCNSGLGLFRDNVVTLESAIKYLQAFEERMNQEREHLQCQ